MPIFNSLTKFLLIPLIAIASFLAGTEYKTTEPIAKLIAPVKPPQHFVKYVTSAQFDRLTNNLRGTLAGNLVTVWRSEWKTKLPAEEANLYIQQMIEHLLTPQSSQKILTNLDLNRQDFITEAARRLEALQKNHLLLPDDHLKIRDPGTTKYAKDSTFTYYAKALVDENGIGKHQVRIRIYLRKINLKEMREGDSVIGYSQNGEEITFTKEGNDLYSVSTIAEKNGAPRQETFNQAELYELFGKPIMVFAQPGGKFKFEVKSALKDHIISDKYPLLDGYNLVQKLDVSMTFKQLKKLFYIHPFASAEKQQLDANKRIDVLESEIITEHPKNKARTRALLAVLREGVNLTPDFLKLEGATHYRRNAFEGIAGFQTTVDSAQQVFLKDIYSVSGELKDPASIYRTSIKYVPKIRTEKHVELKFPISAVVKNLGVDFYQMTDEIDLIYSPPQNEQEIQDTAFIYHQFRKDKHNPGKFNYLIDQNNPIEKDSLGSSLGLSAYRANGAALQSF